MKPLVLLAILAGLLASSHAELRATFTSGGQSVARLLTLPALLVKEGEVPAPGLPPGAFEVTLEGTLLIPKRYRLNFTVASPNQVTLSVNDKEVPLTDSKSPRIRLNAGQIPLKLTLKSHPTGTASLRLKWEERRAFPIEPIPAAAFTTLAAPIDAAHLIASQNCLQCHQSDIAKDHSMPELAFMGPDLTDIGSRVTEEWLTRWIAQPDKLKPTTTMPAMVDHTTPEGSKAAADIAAHLATLGKAPTITPPTPSPTDIQTGGVHFHQLGCVACHTPPAISEPDFDGARIPLNNIAAKFQPAALELFLKDPSTHHLASKMPNFAFSEDEIRTLGAFLRSESLGRHTPDPAEFEPGNPQTGKELVASLNCAACHQGLSETQNTFPKLAALKDWTVGCLSRDQPGKAPRLNLTPEEKEALTPEILPEIALDNLSAYAHRQITELRCASCHDYNGQSAALSRHHQETQNLVAHIENHSATLDQSRPHLTHVGAMLHSDYTTKTLAGTLDQKARPWLRMRMPAYSHHAEKLALGLARHHGLDQSHPEASTPDPEKVKIGHQLVHQGYACNICHGINEQGPLAAFEIKGVNFDLSHERLRADYFHRWLHNPQRLIPSSKMPAYGQAQNDAYQGDTSKQFEAIRAYLQTLPEN